VFSKLFKRENVSNGLEGYIIFAPAIFRYIFAYAKTLKTIGFFYFFLDRVHVIFIVLDRTQNYSRNYLHQKTLLSGDFQ
jgi:DNA helicase HerA-like ATPase